MTLVERFMEFNGWPTSRKTISLSAMGLATQTVSSLAAHVLLARTGVVDMALLDRVMSGGALAFAACLFAGLVAARSGREGRWTAYLTVILFGGFVVAFVQVAGTFSTPFFAFYPLAVIFVALWYDAWIGWFGFVYGLIALIAFKVLEVSGRLPYAPALVDRRLDAQSTIAWGAGIMAPMIFFYGYCFLLILLMIAARKLQQARLDEAHQKLDLNAGLIRRYVPPQLAEKIFRGEHAELSSPRRAKLSIFFSDIVGFTDITERMEPEDLSHLLNEYFSAMTEIAHRYDGTVDELSGDAILILFGAPCATDDKDQALRAVRMAMEMQRATDELNSRWRHAGFLESLKLRIGIDTGVVTVGNFGSSQRMKYAALGKHVNLAARLQAQCTPGSILLSHATWILVREEIPYTEKGEIHLKGIPRAVMAYEVAGSG